MKGNVGMNVLARALAGMASDSGGPRIEWVELGTVLDDLSIRLDRFARPIPRGDYLVAKHLTATPLQPGDRVVGVWANDGTDLIILDAVVTS